MSHEQVFMIFFGKPLRYLLQAFDSEVFGKPRLITCFWLLLRVTSHSSSLVAFELAAFSSTVLLDSRAKLVNNPHHTPSRDRNPGQVIGVDLPAFLLSKSSDPDLVRVPNIPLGFG